MWLILMMAIELEVWWRQKVLTLFLRGGILWLWERVQSLMTG